MIENEREYKISKAWVQKFAEALETAKRRKPRDANDAGRLEVGVAGIQSELEELREAVAQYEALKRNW